MPDRLTAFLYVLMRSHVPAGVVKGIIDELSADEFTLTAPELQQLAERYSERLRPALAFEEDEGEAERVTGGGEDGHVMQVERDEQGVLQPVVGDGWSREMGAWLDSFDDRIMLSPHFAQAVNEAAASEMVADEVSGRLVATRVEELAEQAAREDAPPEPEKTANTEETS